MNERQWVLSDATRRVPTEKTQTSLTFSRILSRLSRVKNSLPLLSLFQNLVFCSLNRNFACSKNAMFDFDK